MPGIDYEKEYDNRGRVKEHPEIFARWAADAKAYREAGWARDAKLDVSYGASARQTYDLFPATSGGDMPLVMFIHGGYWRSLEPAMFSHVARGLNARGFAVALPGYDLCPHVSVATIIEQMRAATLALWRAHNKRIVLTGHSAGGHLAACLLTQDWKAHGAPADLTMAAYAISGVFDLTPLINVSQNADLKLTAQEAHKVSPLFWPAPRGKIFDAAVGGAESSEFLRQSRIIADDWRERGVLTRYEEIAGANHFTAVDPLADPGSAMVARIAAMAGRIPV